MVSVVDFSLCIFLCGYLLVYIFFTFQPQPGRFLFIAVKQAPIRKLVTMAKNLDAIKEVDIDPSGVFKYILIKVHEDKEPPREKIIVRGYKRSPYHSDILEEVESKELTPSKLEGECIGGGRIQHDADGKTIKVYGYSQGFGKADHSIAVALLKNVYKDYNISYSDEGY